MMQSTQNVHHQRWHSYLRDCNEVLQLVEPLEIAGRITKLTGLVMQAAGIKLPIGSACYVPLSEGSRVEAEVVGFDGEHLLLMPQSSVDGVVPGAKVFAMDVAETLPKPTAGRPPRRRVNDRARHLPVGDALLGRVVDGAGNPLDNLGKIEVTESAPLSARPTNPLSRAPIQETLDVGVRAINSMLTVGRGQRMGLFAGSGVGKSVLLGMMARYTTADVIVVGLIGERGREVKEFIEQILGPEGLARSVVVAAPADASALMRLQGANYATTIAESFRNQGKNVLLIMDSLTRYAMAQREIALAIGEPPATKGYPPSVFAKLPALVERTGNGAEGEGSITAFYTVLTEGDDQQDPIADAARAILDGHIVLSRSLAESGHYPAIDVEQSISRAMHNITSPDHQKLARKLKQLNSRYMRSIDLISVGAYEAGSDPVLDTAIAKHELIERFLQQDISERADMEESVQFLAHVLAD
ncbi:flagellar protein export ATPase FliI [Methylophilaceae bacterium 11]|jgi:flagellum-specific ATP synthase|uniref:flagellar protein export ATPase FliI n=1 Tax=Methylotenera sp. 1P/1 TaxID=1131551 RepID=UPI0003827DAE|nr:flagellar protein export ATPase FliI [Methylotenera sp. 1P/1]EUJ10728.1 flagellar protein export ATPase FliI [Methylophilaceae bacterium 11]